MVADGTVFPAVPFNAVVWPTTSQPTASNAEVVRVTNISTNTLTITRGQEGSGARTIIAGDQICAAITAKTLTDVEGTADAASTAAAAAQTTANAALPKAGGTMVGNILGAPVGTGVVGTPAYAFSGDANTGIYSSGADAIDIATGGTRRLTIDSVGLVDLVSGQLNFPATQNASSGVNVLDDYEEGSWTPVISGSGGTSGQSYTTQTGHYTKVGKLVVASFIVTLSAKGTITTNAQISGLPFTSDSGAYNSAALDFSNLNTNWITVNARLGPSATVASLLGIQAAATNNNSSLTTADITNTTQFIGTFVYRASA